MKEELIKKIANAKAVTFDIFDTLLVRPVFRPNDVFSFIDDKYKIGSLNFREKREKAFCDAVRRYTSEKKEEVSYEEIYNQFEIDSLKRLKNKELEIEADILKVNPEGKEIFDYAISEKKEVYLISDMFLPEDFIIKVLELNGYKGYKNIYLSSRYNRLKYTGNLYKIFLIKESLLPQEVVHVGDNKQSDILSAERIGLNTFYLMNNADKIKASFPALNTFYERNPYDLTRSVILGLFAKNASKLDYWEKIGYLYSAPLCVSFVQWLINFSERLQISQLLFVLRDGYSLLKCFNKIYKGDVKAVGVVAPRSISTSFTLDFKDKLDNEFEKRDAIVTILKSFKNELIKESNDFPDLGNADECFSFYMNNQELIKNIAENKSRAYERYLKNKAIREGKVAIVDMMTTYFSAQKLIINALSEHRDIIGLYFFVSKMRKVDRSKYEYFQQTNRFYNIPLIEFLVTAPFPSVKDVSLAGEPVYREASKQEKIRIDRFEKVLKGADKFYQDLIYEFESTGLPEFDPNSVIDLIDFFVANPTEEDKSQWAEIFHSWDSEHSTFVKTMDSWYK